MNRLFIKKLVLAFALGFVPVFLYGLLDILDAFSHGEADYNLLASIAVAAVTGALSAGIRAVLALFTNWMPTDNLHGIGDNPERVTVTKNS
jgi:hypothetical protein